MEALDHNNIRKTRRKASRGLPLIITLVFHGLLMLWLIVQPFSRLTEDNLNYITLNTDLMQFEEINGDDAPSFSSSQHSNSQDNQSQSATTSVASTSDAAVNINDTTALQSQGGNATPDSLSGSGLMNDTLNYMDFYSGGIGGGRGGTGVMAGNLKLPTFMGGDFNSFRNWFLRHFRKPIDAPDDLEERVMVSFSVDKSGKMQNIKVRSCSSPEVAREIVRVLNTAPKWEPGLYNDDFASYNLQMPVNFKGY